MGQVRCHEHDCTHDSDDGCPVCDVVSEVAIYGHLPRAIRACASDGSARVGLGGHSTRDQHSMARSSPDCGAER